MLAPLLLALLSEFGQDAPLTLKRLADPQSSQLESVGAQSSPRSVISPFSHSVSSLLSNPGDSLLSQTMGGYVPSRITIVSTTDSIAEDHLY